MSRWITRIGFLLLGAVTGAATMADYIARHDTRPAFTVPPCPSPKPVRPRGY